MHFLKGASPRPFARANVERVIAAVRVIIAGSALFAVLSDPAEPARHVELVYSLHVVFLVYAIAVGAVMWRYHSVGRLPFLTHVSDIVMASVLQYLTLGPSSPFFTYFLYALSTAALRWEWQ